MIRALLPALVLLCACGSARPAQPGGIEDGGVEALDGGAPDVDAGGSGDAGCAPTGPGTVVVGALGGARRIASDGSWLYVTETRSLSGSEGRVFRVPIAGGQAETVAQGLSAPDALAVGGGDAFFLAGDGLWRVRLDGGIGAAVKVDGALNNSLYGDTEIALVGDQVVFSTGLRWLVRVNRDGSGHVDLFTGVPGSAVHGLAVRDGTVWFLVSGLGETGLYRVPLDGSAAAVRVSAGPADGHALLADGDGLLVSDGEADGGIRWYPQDGGAPVDVAVHQDFPRRMARAQDGALYFTVAASQPDAGFLRLAGGCDGGIEPAGPLGQGPGDVLRTGGIVFFTSQASSPDGYLGRL